MSANGSGKPKKGDRVGQIYPVRIFRVNGGDSLQLVRTASPVEQRVQFWKKEKDQKKMLIHEAFISPAVRRYNIFEKLVDSFITTDTKRIAKDILFVEEFSSGR